jgi:acetyl/propionyl-CoA carboxylase alpha subunit
MFRRILIANRGEIAIRIARAASDLGIETVAIYTEDDRASLHVSRADHAVPLRGRGVRPYLDIEQVVAAATDNQCDAIHPGYGFLSENSDFARRCEQDGTSFIGPRPELLSLLGAKEKARALAVECGVPVTAGTEILDAAADARAFMQELGKPIILKALAGGGGRGIRVVRHPCEVVEAFDRCTSEALSAFGNGAIYAEQYVERPRHIEVQILGDKHGNVVTLGDRDCSLQRRHQKVIELAPAPWLNDDVRAAITKAALAIATATSYDSVGTIEFLLSNDGTEYYFLEANPRIQVEHTVTESVTGVDIVSSQIQVAAGVPLHDLDVYDRDCEGTAIQLRVTCEQQQADGTLLPSPGTLSRFDVPTGPGVRVDTAGYTGFTVGASFDSLLAKVVCHSPKGVESALRLAGRALREFNIEGVHTNIGTLIGVLERNVVAPEKLDTHVYEQTVADLPSLVVGTDDLTETFDAPQPVPADIRTAPPGSQPVTAPMSGSVVSIDVASGDSVKGGQQLAVVEAMKLETVVRADVGGTIVEMCASPGQTVAAGAALMFLEPSDSEAVQHSDADAIDLERVPAAVQKVVDRHSHVLDGTRREAIAARHQRGKRSMRENIDQLVDEGTFTEIGGLAIAAQRTKRSLADLIDNTPADGVIVGTARVNGSPCAVIAYDPTVLAGTQGHHGHLKTERIARIAERQSLPVVVFAEGGGGRPGEVDQPRGGSLRLGFFAAFSRLNGVVPLIGIATGRTFAGNAAMIGCSDVAIATRDSNIGMAGPAMIEAGGLGRHPAEAIGPAPVQAANGVIDILVDTDQQAIEAAKRYLSYFQGPATEWESADQRLLDHLVPENRLRSYDMFAILETLADSGSVTELRPGFGRSVRTVLARLEGRPVAIIANDPRFLGGAIDTDAADKATRFMQLADAFGIPLVILCDTPGFMVGPEEESRGLVRHAARMFTTGSRIAVPVIFVSVRKAYGLGAMAMAIGGFDCPTLTLTWPAGEYAAMGIEGGVRLSHRRELEAIADATERDALLRRLVDEQLEEAGALNSATLFDVDDVIAPSTTRQRIIEVLEREPWPSPHRGRRPLDTW